MTIVADMPQREAPVRRPPARAERFHRLVSRSERGALAALSRAGLHVLSWPYGLGVRVRNALFDRGLWRTRRAAVPVVSIGNLTLGGTGKTPAVEYVARFLRQHDRRVAILSRGYGSRTGQNDEARVLEENLPGVPHLQEANRAESAKFAVQKLHSELLILDDGFQHRRLHRDLDIVLVDATNPWGYGHLFPRGLLREPRSSLRRASLVLLTRCDQVEPWKLQELRVEIGRLAPSVPVVESIHQPQRLVNGDQEAPLGVLSARPLAAFCGIGNPEAFRQTLARLSPSPLWGRGVRGEGVSTARCPDPLTPSPSPPRKERGEEFATFPDHHAYTRADIDWLQAWARQLPEDALVITTQKDLVKLRLPDLAGRPLWALQIALRPTKGRDVLDRMLEGTLA